MKRWTLPAAAPAVVWAVLMMAAAFFGCAASKPQGDGTVGSRLYHSRCRSCHAPYKPTRKTLDWWQKNLDRYAQRARLTPVERDSVMAYVARVVGGEVDK